MKLHIFPLALFTALTLSACGNSETTEQTTSTDTLAQDTTAKLAAVSAYPADFDPTCADAAKCGDADCQSQIVGLHSLPSQAHFQNMIDAYRAENTAADTAPLKKNLLQINQMLGTADCASNRVQFDVATSPITLKVIPGYFEENETNTYSIALFKGLIAKGATQFKFYRAKNIEKNYATLAIYAYNNDNTYEFYGDLSDTHPHVTPAVTAQPANHK